MLAMDVAEMNLEEMLKRIMKGCDENSEAANAVAETLQEHTKRDRLPKLTDLVRERSREIMEGIGGVEVVLSLRK